MIGVLPGKKCIALYVMAIMCGTTALAQKNDDVRVVKDGTKNKIDVWIGKKLFTSFLYPDTLEKPVLYPVFTASGKDVTRGFPMNPKAGDPTDHPHHIGIWFNWENLNGLDFWNNSYAIPADKKKQYGWVKTDRILQSAGGKTGVLSYHANWTNQQNEVLVEETTRLEFSQQGSKRIIDRVTDLKAVVEATFTDAKDGMYAIRLAHELQIPSLKDEKFTDSKGIVTVVKGGTDKIANGNYVTSEGATGDAAWSTRASWCKVYGKMDGDSVSVVIIDHPKNINYPTFWHARGYGLFAANPLGEKIFTNGKSEKNLKLKPGETVSFRFRLVVDEGAKATSSTDIKKLAADFSSKK
ncbi:PmoA family protein [Hufsiella ginkgonis]|uniref:Methane oxygenase PmoA n=1 Tax=Hufsiella ginkgonis TaxID=2695274 RepID=A0A7K1XUL6_9SPHI|nr:PmoA family protein [Hufsiella ginkgonis]MXV14674.1 hypothetical protein [Hufsiella ginkgonis]